MGALVLRGGFLISERWPCLFLLPEVREPPNCANWNTDTIDVNTSSQLDLLHQCSPRQGLALLGPRPRPVVLGGLERWPSPGSRAAGPQQERPR